MYQGACNGPGEPPSSTRTGTDEFLPRSLGLGSQSTGIFLLQVWAFLRSCAPSLPWQTCQTQVMPCRHAPKSLWEVWICTVGVGGTKGWGEVGHCKSSLLPRLSPAAPARLPPAAQRPGPDHSCCLTWERNSREDPTRFCCYRLKHDLASGKSSQRHVTIRFSVCSYQVLWDVICKYLSWIIFPCPTRLFSAGQSSCSSSLGRASPVSCGVPGACAGTRCPGWLGKEEMSRRCFPAH